MKVRDCRTGVIKSVLDWMLAEMDSCDMGIQPEEKPVFHALALILNDELRLRDPRRKPLVLQSGEADK